MSKKRYPYLSSDEPMKGRGARCDLCDEAATHKVEIEVSWFRGDDEVYHVCQAHRPDRRELNRFFSLLEAKDKERGITRD